LPTFIVNLIKELKMLPHTLFVITAIGGLLFYGWTEVFADNTSLNNLGERVTKLETNFVKINERLDGTYKLQLANEIRNYHRQTCVAARPQPWGMLNTELNELQSEYRLLNKGAPYEAGPCPVE